MYTIGQGQSIGLPLLWWWYVEEKKKRKTGLRLCFLRTRASASSTRFRDRVLVRDLARKESTRRAICVEWRGRVS